MVVTSDPILASRDHARRPLEVPINDSTLERAFETRGFSRGNNARVLNGKAPDLRSG